MKINLDQHIRDLNGKQITDGDSALTLRHGVVFALQTPMDEDKGMSPDKAVERWKLCMRLHSGGEQDISPEDAALIRSRLVKVWAVVLAGQAIEMLKG